MNNDEFGYENYEQVKNRVDKDIYEGLYEIHKVLSREDIFNSGLLKCIKGVKLEKILDCIEFEYEYSDYLKNN